MVLHGRQRREGKVKAEMSRLWPPSLNTHCLTGVCDLCVAFVLECKVSQDSAVEENEEQLEIPWWDPDSLCQALSLGGQATAWEGSPGRCLCLTKILEFAAKEATLRPN